MKIKVRHWAPTAVAVILAVAIIIAAYCMRIRVSEGFTTADELYLVMFKADWCPHCQHALPQYKELMAAMNGSQVGGSRLYFDIIDPELDSDRVNVSVVDKTMEVEVKSKYSVSQRVKLTGFPTYMLYGRSSGPVRYTGALDRESLTAFLGPA